jgi:hypothetical protein
MRRSLSFLLIALGCSSASLLRAEPKPGDVFREYVWSNRGVWTRLTGPDATMEGAKAHLPNPVNSVELPDLADATRIEVQVELLQSHYGTTGQALRLNGGEWIQIPASKKIPGQLGTKEGPPEMWLSMRYPEVDVPLAAVKSGANVLEFTSRSGSAGLGSRWPQSLVYGAIFRVYYGPNKPAPSGRVVVPTGTPTRYGVIELAAEPVAASGRAIRRVDFFAKYHGYDWRGEGVADEWHYQTFFGALRRHAGTAYYAPWRAAWDIRDIPSQEAPVQVIARIEDDTGLSRMTEPVTLEKFKGVPRTALFVAHQIPQAWQTRAGRKISCKITLPDDLSGLVSAKLILASWSGGHADAIGINDTVLVRKIGIVHDLSYDEITVPVSALKPGENEFFTQSNTTEHGIEVLWPGAAILAHFAPPEAKSAAAAVAPTKPETKSGAK